MNVELLKKVKEYITAHPNRFVMDNFLIKQREGETIFDADDGKEVKFDQCGTAACIAGWTCLIATEGKVREGTNIQRKAGRLLGISPGKQDNLFFTCNWPEHFVSQYLKAATQSSRAKIAARRIDHFIATEGRE
jgi:hypothetical protein